jgi:uncharacterized membrane protein YphA (DoxX/SURF4 family)
MADIEEKYEVLLKHEEVTMLNKLIIWALRLIPTAIMLLTLQFKFTAHPQSVRLFTILGMEPWGRIGIGVMELIAGILLLIPRFTWMGALLGIGLMGGAIFFHISNPNVGIAFEGSTSLFINACITLASCLVLLIIFRKQVITFCKSIFKLA